MEFIDRNYEQKRLRDALNNSKKKFIVIYGRRRLGKSTLVKRILKSGDVYYEATKDEASMQRTLLAETIALTYNGFDTANYPTWEGLLSNFNHRANDNATLVLDEFPYLVQQDASLPSVIQKLIDSGSLRYNLIVCGSSQRMMQRLIIDHSEPLYGRADEKINLRPIRPQHWSKALNLDAVATIEEYSVWGGVPRYWALREDCKSLKSAINHLILDEHGILNEEPKFLFLDESDSTAPYSSVMTAIGKGNTRISKIADALGKRVPELYATMSNLLSMHYVRKDVPFGESEEKSKKTLYKISDPFMAFYYKFIAPHRTLLALGRTEFVGAIIKKQMPEHVSHLWETLCQEAVSGNELFGHTWNLARRWWGKAPIYQEGRKTPVGFDDLEFDVVAESISSPGTILVGECKWKSADYADRLLEQLKVKAQKAPFTQGKRIVYALFLKEAPLSSADCNIMLPNDVLDCLPE